MAGSARSGMDRRLPCRSGAVAEATRLGFRRFAASRRGVDYPSSQRRARTTRWTVAKRPNYRPWTHSLTRQRVRQDRAGQCHDRDCGAGPCRGPRRVEPFPRDDALQRRSPSRAMDRVRPGRQTRKLRRRYRSGQARRGRGNHRTLIQWSGRRQDQPAEAHQAPDVRSSKSRPAQGPPHDCGVIDDLHGKCARPTVERLCRVNRHANPHFEAWALLALTGLFPPCAKCGRSLL